MKQDSADDLAMSAELTPAGFGIYIHWPFCQSKCPYCDFNSHVATGVDETAWLRAFRKELGRYQEETPQKIVSSVFFGGGTPSLMSPWLVNGILEAVRSGWRISNDMEVTLEANPGSVDLRHFRGYREAGVNRVSLGIQSLSDVDLRRLGRTHSVRDAMIALDVAKSTFERVNADLIYARQDQDCAAWEVELTTALEFGVDHLSLYQLTIEPETVFAARAGLGKLHGLPDEKLSVELFELTQALCSNAGYNAYEVSNHARGEAECRHNLIYWTGRDYLGVGPGAHGRISTDIARYATESHRLPREWLAQAELGSAESLRVELTGKDQAIEYLIMGLRLTEGVSLNRLAQMVQLDRDAPRLTSLLEHSFLKIEDDRLMATPAGRLVLNSVLTELICVIDP